MKNPPVVVVICMQGAGHIQLLLPVIEALCARGCAVVMLTDSVFRQRVEAVGAEFVDLYAGRPLAAVDSRSLPIPSRFVTFAGVHAESMIREVQSLEPSMIIYDTFSVIAPIIARALGVPYVNVCPNHAPVPSRTVAELQTDPRVSTSPECLAAIERLRTIHELPLANPFSYMEGVSPHLNLYPEPEEFLDAGDRTSFEPIAFFGSLPEGAGRATAPVFPSNTGRQRIYISFGTLVWRYFPAETNRALATLCSVLAKRNADVLISLGGRAQGPELSPGAPNIRLEKWVDQWAALEQADVFVTHHGINSTHEAIFHRVPMLSYPFFGDQPALAQRCQNLGLALPLVNKTRSPITGDRVLAVLDRIDANREGFSNRLEEARSWELRTVSARATVIDRLLRLMEAE